MILFTIICAVLSEQIVEIDKTIYLTQGEVYKVNLDSIFKENVDNTYSFVLQSKGFTIDQTNLRLKNDQGTYSISKNLLIFFYQDPTKILRQRQLINLEDYQGKGQFGILDQYDSGHRICYNSDDTSTSLDECFGLQKDAYNYDFVFVDKDTIAVSKIRISDGLFGVAIYQNSEIISDFYFTPSRSYDNIGQTIIEYCQFGSKKYLLYGVTEVVDSNIEFLEIQENFQTANTNNFIEKSLLPVSNNLQVLSIKGLIDKVIIVVKVQINSQHIFTFYYKNKWSADINFLFGGYLRALELGYSIIEQKLTQTVLECDYDFYYVTTWDDQYVFTNLLKPIKNNAQVKYTLNYLIISQDNSLIISTLFKLSQRTHIIEGTILNIDVDFQNDLVFVFTNSKILTYYLKPATLSFQSNTVTESLDLITIKGVAGDVQQFANIHFQVLAKDDYSLHQLLPLTKDLYYNRAFASPNNNILTNGMSGPDIRVNAKADNQVKIISHYLDEYVIEIPQTDQKQPIYEEFVSSYYNPFLFRQYDDFSIQIYDCRLNQNKYECLSSITISTFKQKVSIQSTQVGQQTSQYALISFDHQNIYTYTGQQLNSIISADGTIIFGTMTVGTDRLFTYTVSDEIGYYQFPSGQLITKFKLSQFGKPVGTISRNLWVNQAKSNILVLSYGDELLIFRFTSELLLIQRLAIKLVQDVAILSDDKMIIFHTESEIDILTQYQLFDGQFKIQKELDTHGFLITGFELYKDYGNAKIIIQAQKDQQKVLLVYGDTELARDSLLKIIPLKEDETGIVAIQNQQETSLLKRKIGDKTYNSSIIDISYLYQVIEINQGEIHNKFSQQLDLTYSFTNSFSQNSFQTIKHLFLEYQFYNLTAKQDPNNSITYKHESELQIPIKQDTFQGQVRTVFISTTNEHLRLTTRFKNNKASDISQQSSCKYLTTFQRILCINGLDVTYHDQNGKQLSTANLVSLSTSPLKQLVLHNDEKFAIVVSSGQLMLIYISENEIKNSMVFYSWNRRIEISIFFKEWFVNYEEDSYLRYYQFQPQNNDLWSLEKKNQYYSYGIYEIQYDPYTKQILYSTGDEDLFYFESSLEGSTIDKKTVYSFNLVQFLQTQKIYQLNTRITNLQVKDYRQKSYLFVSTTNGNILNMTIKSITEQFTVNSVYIANGGSNVKDIQFIDECVLIQIGNYQLLYKNANNWQLDSPYLSLEVIAAQDFMVLYKNGSQIVHLYQNPDDQKFYQANIDDNVYLTISNLKTYKPGKIQIGAFNGYGEARLDYQTIQLKDEESSSNSWIWIVAGIIAVIAILGGGFYCYKRKQSVDPLLG